MAETKYSYGIVDDTANSKVDSDALKKETQNTATITVSLNRVETEGGFVDLYFNAALPDDSFEDQVTILDGVVAAHTGVSLISEKLNIDGIQLVDIVASRRGSQGSKSRTIVSHDYSERQTWYQKSVRVTDETVSGDSAGLVYTAVNPNWIDIYHEKCTTQYANVPLRTGAVSPQSDFEYVVKLDDVVTTTGFTVDFALGEVTFDSDQSSAVVKMSYSHNDGVARRSEFLLTPATGKKLVLEHVECQFSKSTILNGACRFEVWAGNTLSFFDTNGWVDAVFDGGYGQYRMDYRGFKDFINIGNLGTGVIPVLSDIDSETCVFPFNYLKSIELKSSQLATIRVIILQDLEATSCDMGTVTFYVEECDE